MSDDRDPILDACLEELLGGRRPPDLTRQILGRFKPPQAPAGGHDLARADAAGQVRERETTEMPTRGLAEATPALHAAYRRRSRREWTFTAGVCLLLMAGLAMVLVTAQALLQDRHPVGQPAERATAVRSLPGETRGVSDPASRDRAALPPDQRLGDTAAIRRPTASLPSADGPDPLLRQRAEKIGGPPAESLGGGAGGGSPESPRPESSSHDSQDVATANPLAQGREQPIPGAPKGASVGGSDAVEAAVPAARRLTDPAAPLVALDDREVVSRIDAMIRDHWLRRRVEPLPRITDKEWCQRLYRVVVGREPTAAELGEFAGAASPDKRSQLIDRLLDSDALAEDFARHWSQAWTSTFLDPVTLAANPPGGGGGVSHEGMLQYFRRSFLDRKPLNQVLSGLLTATGSGVPGDREYNGAANFLLARMDADRVQATADVARLFLGRNMSCQQCHDDPHFDAGQQQEFWELNGFFRQLAFGPRPTGEPPRLVDADVREERASSRGAGVFYTTADGVVKVAFPVFVDGEAIPTSGEIAQVQRRRELARRVIASEEFRRNVANRVWGMVMGQPLAEPEQIVRRKKAVHPEPVVLLGDQLAAHGFDLRRLIRWTVQCAPFELAGGEFVPAANRVAGADEPQELAALFDRFYERRAVSNTSVHQALVAVAREFRRESSAAATAARRSESPARVDPGSSPGRAAEASIRAPLGGAIAPTAPLVKVVLATTRLSARQKADHLFLMALHRLPNRQESAAVDRLLQSSLEDPDEALRVLWGALQVR